MYASLSRVAGIDAEMLVTIEQSSRFASSSVRFRYSSFFGLSSRRQSPWPPSSPQSAVATWWQSRSVLLTFSTSAVSGSSSPAA